MQLKRYAIGSLLLIGVVVTLLTGPLPILATPPIQAEHLAVEGLLFQPGGIAFRPQAPHQLWVTNHGNDSIAILDLADPMRPTGQVRQDAYAEHFVASPTAIAFGADDTFAVANDSINDLRGMEFVLNPERNLHFVNNHFMGPTLFAAKTYALAGQNKQYLDDWPQPGIGHDPPNDMTVDEGCPPDYWSATASQCFWPREGSHLDMLHESPLAMGIVHERNNIYFLLDGCGSRDADQQCRGNGHLVRYDFNHDHQEGNGYHGDGVVWRYPEVTFRRVAGVPSGMVLHNGSLYFANTGLGTVDRVDPDTGRVELMVAGWAGTTEQDRVGPGPIDWAHLPNAPGDGDSPEQVEAWIASKGNQTAIAALGDAWIRPLETLSGYAYVYDVPQTTVVAEPWLRHPSALAGDTDALYVADYGSGWLAAIDWRSHSVLWRYQTGLKSIAGLAINPDQPRELYVTDSTSTSLTRLRW